MATPLTYTWFYERVRNGGTWDYKQQKRAYADFGNFHYGAVGYAACIPEKILLIAAGAAQWKAGTSRPEWGNFTGAPPFGDDPMDQFWIKHKSGCNNEQKCLTDMTNNRIRELESENGK